MVAKIFVVAGTDAEAFEWIKQDCDRRWHDGETSLSLSDYVICSSTQKLRGIYDIHGYLVGTWRQRKDIEEILRLILLSSSGKNETIKKLYKEQTAPIETSNWVYEDELPLQYPYERMYEYSRIIDGVRMFPLDWKTGPKKSPVYWHYLPRVHLGPEHYQHSALEPNSAFWRAL